MKARHSRLLSLVWLSSVWVSLGGASTLPAQRKPAVEFSTLLDSVHIYAKGPSADQGGKLFFGGPRSSMIQAVFLPAPDNWDPSDVARSGGHRLWASLTKAGTQKAKITFMKSPMDGVFSQFRTRGMSGSMIDEGFQNEYQFTEAGDYLLTFMADKEALTRVPLKVRFVQIGDDFDGQKITLVDGPWNNLAYISIGIGGPNGPVSFEAYLRRVPTGANQANERYTVEILQGGDVVAVGGSSVVSTPEWRRASFRIKYPKGQGRGVYGSQNLLQKDGDYHVVMKKNGQIYGVYSFVAKGGKIVPHPRQVSGYKPRLDYLVPRRWASPAGNRYTLNWLDRKTGPEALSIVNAKPAAVEGPSAATRAAWVVKSSAPADAPFKLVVTQAKLRPDTALAVGDGIIAYGTGGYTGVEYLKVGEDKPTSIPNGQEFLASMIGVCGKKIALFNKNKTCAVFDTASKKLHEIPATEVQFARLAGGPYKANQYATSGRLIATVNDQSQVADRTTIKVIDVSGATPRVIGIKNPADLQAKLCTSIAVDAATGKVAVSSKRNSAIYVADVASKAIARKFDLSGHDGVRDAPIHVAGGFVLYQDASGSSKVRLIDIAKGQVLTPSLNPVPGRPAGRTLVAGKYVYTLKEGRGSNYHVAMGIPGKESMKANNSGKPGPQRSGELGMGASVAVAADGTVFLAGQGAIASGSFLQCLGASGSWSLVGPGGKPLPASDVVAGPGLVAFRTGKSRNVAVAYATFGAKIDPGSAIVK